MPAMMTHDFFGQDAYGAALGAVSLYTPDERNAFLLGNQGPDPLFYLMLLPPLNDFRVLGTTMHRLEPSALLCAFRTAADELPEEQRGIARAYVAGFTCHYLLDRAVHPLVYFWERGICGAGVPDLDTSDGGIVHAEIERDLDEMVLYVKRSETIRSYRPYEQVLRGSEEVLDVIGELYFNTIVGPLAEGEPSARAVFPLAVECFRVAQRMFFSPGGTKANVLAHVESPLLKNRYSLVKAMSHRVRPEMTSDFDNRAKNPWRNPFTGSVTNDSFWDIYNRTLDEVAPALDVVFGEGFNEAEALALTRGLNFSGEPVAEGEHM